MQTLLRSCNKSAAVAATHFGIGAAARMLGPSTNATSAVIFGTPLYEQLNPKQCVYKLCRFLVDDYFKGHLGFIKRLKLASRSEQHWLLSPLQPRPLLNNTIIKISIFSIVRLSHLVRALFAISSDFIKNSDVSGDSLKLHIHPNADGRINCAQTLPLVQFLESFEPNFIYLRFLNRETCLGVKNFAL